MKRTIEKRGHKIFKLLATVFLVGIVTCGCVSLPLPNIGGGTNEPAPQEAAPALPAVNENKEEVKTEPEANAESIDLDVDTKKSGAMVSYDVASTGRADPFMPYGEMQAFEEARKSAIAEANAYNSKLSEIAKLKGQRIRELDDINPYSFNLPVPPTSLASDESAAAKITRTKVVGIMYNKTSPSAIISLDSQDYLVRPGDKIMDQEYKVIEINPSWITVGLGSNIYSASIGELFAKEDLDKSGNDLYNLRNRFGGRKG